MAIPEQFSLRWNDFHSNLSQSFHALLEGKDLVDVTLAAGGQYVHAHKLILSVCSPYFKELFKMNPCEHPIVILKDVALQELRLLLQFMYRGEVHVRQQELFGFLQTAELLQVKGLTGGREKSESPTPTAEEAARQAVVAQESDSQEWVPGGEDTTATEAPTLVEPVVVTEGDVTKNQLKRLLKTTLNKNSHVKKKPRPVNDVPDNADAADYISDIEPLVDCDSELYHSVLVKSESKESNWNCKAVKCPSCHRFFANRYNLKVHIRDKHDVREGTLQCEICQKRMRNPSCLRVHMYHHRKQAAYISQLSGQDHMKHMVQNMVGGKLWRNESASLVDYKFPSERAQSVPTAGGKGWHSDASLVDSKFIDSAQNSPGSGKNWQNDSASSADYEFTDVKPTSPPPEPNLPQAAQEPPKSAETEPSDVKYASMNKVETNAEIV